MQKPLVYVEISIPSFYHELRTTPDVVARREWTRQWWTEAPDRYELVTSPAVLNELSAGDIGTQCAAVVVGSRLAIATSRAGNNGDRGDLCPTEGDASGPGWRCASLGHRFFSQMRFSRDLELRSPRQCQQVRTYPPRQHDAWSVCPRSRNATGITWSRS